MYRNHRHLDCSDRIAIETGLYQGLTFKRIAKKLGRHPSTIAHEIKANRTFIKGRFPLGRDCLESRRCTVRNLCPEPNCKKICRTCIQQDCRMFCSRYQQVKCLKVEVPPYTCNTCTDKRLCTKPRYLYSAKFADAVYIRRRSESRAGIRLKGKDLEDMDRLITRLVKKGQPLSHIHAEHKEELPVSLRSLYNYIDGGVLTIKNLDLRRKTSYRPRKKPTVKKPGFQNQEYRKGRTYDDFQTFLQKYPSTPIVEMDTVKGVRESGKRMLTMIFRENSVMLLFLMPDGTAESVVNVFDFLTDTLGLEAFQRLFPVLLTDNGSEFKRVKEIERACTEERRTRVFFCDPQASWQKPHIEKNHEFIRYVIPRGKSFTPYTEDDITLLMNHINSVKRRSLSHRSPYDLVLQGDEDMEWLMTILGMHTIPPDDVHLKADLFKK